MDLVSGCCQDVPCLSMEFRMVSNLRTPAAGGLSPRWRRRTDPR